MNSKVTHAQKDERIKELMLNNQNLNEKIIEAAANLARKGLANEELNEEIVRLRGQVEGMDRAMRIVLGSSRSAIYNFSEEPKKRELHILAVPK